MTKSDASFISKSFTNLLRPVFFGWFNGSVTEQRARQENSARLFRLPKQVRVEQVSFGGITSEWIESPISKAGAILYLHGGAYALGYYQSHRALVARLVTATNTPALAVNYRLAPENPFPAALEDALNAYQWLLSKGIPPTRICLAGDSAGGGLAIAALVALRDQGIPLPAGAFCFSPWLDLTMSGETITSKSKLDPILNTPALEKFAEYYAGSHNTIEPLISPVFADLRGLPPIQLHSGSNEILLDDSVRFCEKAIRSGVDCRIQVWDDMFHVFQMFSFLPETAESLGLVSIFVKRIFNEQATG